jgi:hypothetical protein
MMGLGMGSVVRWTGFEANLLHSAMGLSLLPTARPGHDPQTDQAEETR